MGHRLRVTRKYFNAIRDDIKIVDIRLLDNKSRKIKTGDTIEFICDNDNIIKSALFTRYARGFKAATNGIHNLFFWCLKKGDVKGLE